MGDSKSKFPDFQEILGMGRKLFSDIKKSFCEIISAHKEKKSQETKKSEKKETQPKPQPKPSSTKAEEQKAPKSAAPKVDKGKKADKDTK